MSVTSPYQSPETEAADFRQYQTTSKAAIASMVFGVLSLLAFLVPPLLVFPLLSIACGLIAVSNFRQFGIELLGRLPAKIGLGLGVFSLVGALGLHSYIYVTEVPEGYQRINFRMLQDDPMTRLPYSEKAEELDGKKVFVRGYVRPSTKRKSLKEFIMVGSFGACCFGGTEELTDVIAVKIKIDKTVDYSLRLRKIGGTFRLNRKATLTGDKEVPRVFYQIEADYLK